MELVNGVEVVATIYCYSLVRRLLPDVAFATAAKMNGVTSLPLIPFCSACFSASLIELSMTASAEKANFR
jgi:hypothetical protein